MPWVWRQWLWASIPLSRTCRTASFPSFSFSVWQQGASSVTLLTCSRRFQNLTDRFSASGSNLAQGLSTGIMLFCIGTLSILGPIESALHGDHTFLFTNATLDFVTSMVLASTYGIGIAIAAGVPFLWQGRHNYLLATCVASSLSADLLYGSFHYWRYSHLQLRTVHSHSQGPESTEHAAVTFSTNHLVRCLQSRCFLN